MSIKKLSIAEEQQKTKPKIEDIINELLEGDKRQNALDFVAYLREQKLNPRWKATNAWAVKYKGKWLISIDVKESNSWNIGWWHLGCDFLDNFSNEYQEIKSFDKYKEIIWANVKYCTNCAKCSPGTNKEIFEKNFELLCYGFLLFNNPDIDTLECAKKLLESKKKVIASNA